VLEQILQKFRGVVLLLLIGMLAAVFVLQFGPQSQGYGTGAAGAAAEVYGESITRSELQSAHTLAGGENYPEDLAKQHKLEQMVLFGLIERDLLAREAHELGYGVSEEEVLARIAEDGVMHLSMSIDAGPYLPPSGPQRFSFENSQGEFSKDNLKSFVQYRLRRSIREFTRSQAQETLAQRMRDLVTAGVTVSPGEAYEAWVREKENVTLQYVRFSASYYGQKLELTPDALATFMKDQAAAVDAEYEKQKHRYTGLEKQVRARHILIKVESSADEATKAAARAKIDALHARAKKGEDFAALATEHSQDEGTAKKGGDLGYNPKGRMVAPFDEAQFALAPQQISDVVESTFGFHVIKVEGVREGDVPVEEAKRELAEKLWRDQQAGELAKQAAETLLKKAQAGATLEQATAELNGVPVPAPGAEPAETPELDPLAPQVRDTRPFGRTDTAIAGPFDSGPLVKAAYELTEEKPLGAAPMQLGGDYFVYRLQMRNVAKPADFTEAERDRLTAALLRRRKTDVLDAYVRSLRDKAVAAGKIDVDPALSPEETKETPAAPAEKPKAAG
jgi:peptidyl-prolyl cis-trans isomerase D